MEKLSSQDREFFMFVSRQSETENTRFPYLPVAIYESGYGFARCCCSYIEDAREAFKEYEAQGPLVCTFILKGTEVVEVNYSSSL